MKKKLESSDTKVVTDSVGNQDEIPTQIDSLAIITPLSHIGIIASKYYIKKNTL